MLLDPNHPVLSLFLLLGAAGSLGWVLVIAVQVAHAAWRDLFQPLLEALRTPTRPRPAIWN